MVLCAGLRVGLLGLPIRFDEWCREGNSGAFICPLEARTS